MEKNFIIVWYRTLHLQFFLKVTLPHFPPITLGPFSTASRHAPYGFLGGGHGLSYEVPSESLLPRTLLS